MHICIMDEYGEISNLSLDKLRFNNVYVSWMIQPDDLNSFPRFPI